MSFVLNAMGFAHSSINVSFHVDACAAQAALPPLVDPVSVAEAAAIARDWSGFAAPLGDAPSWNTSLSTSASAPAVEHPAAAAAAAAGGGGGVVAGTELLYDFYLQLAWASREATSKLIEAAKSR